MPAAFLCRSANVVAIAFVTTFSCMVWSHGTVTANTTNQSLEQSPKLVSNHDATGSPVMLQLLLNLLPKFNGYDRVVFAFMDLILVADFAKVGDVREQLEQRTLVKVSATAFFAALCNGQFVLPTAPIDFLDRLNDRLALEIQFESSTDLCGLVFVDHDLATLAIVVISERSQAATPFAFATSGRHFVSCSLRNDLAFELGGTGRRTGVR